MDNTQQPKPGRKGKAIASFALGLVILIIVFLAFLNLLIPFKPIKATIFLSSFGFLLLGPILIIIGLRLPKWNITKMVAIIIGLGFFLFCLCCLILSCFYYFGGIGR